MRTMLLSLAIAFTLPACLADDASPRDLGVIVDPGHAADPSTPRRHAEADGLATPEDEYYCEQDADCGPGLTCIIQRHSCFDERGRLAESNVTLGPIGE